MTSANQILDERNRQILCAVIQCHINTPVPVGSRAITKKYSFGLSSATIRNIMADLEEMGFLRQPHTSAGRVPTDSGYRFYVDTLTVENSQTSKAHVTELYKKLDRLRKDINTLPDETSRMLSAVSHYIGITMSSNDRLTTLSRIQLHKFKKNRLAVVLITDEGMIRHKVVTIDTGISQKDLNRISEYINAEFAGAHLEDIRKSIARELARDKMRYDKLVTQAIKICRSIFSATTDNVFISGLSEVLDLPDFCDIDKIRELLKTIEDKELIVKLLDIISASEGTQVFIGSENPLDEMRKFSFVVSTYKEQDKPVGAIGIIGPTRMHYEKAISIVDMTAQFITNMLSKK
jgi:heat-inducible transcriptional repressor